MYAIRSYYVRVVITEVPNTNFPVAVFEFLQRKCIVKIFGINRVNGESYNVSYIPTSFNLFF